MQGFKNIVILNSANYVHNGVFLQTRGEPQYFLLIQLRNVVLYWLSSYSQNNSDNEGTREGAHTVCIVKMSY